MSILTRSRIETRGEWMASPTMGWPVAGLCTSAIWAQWGEVLHLLYQDMSAAAIAEMIGVMPAVILNDLREFGIKIRARGGARYKGPSFDRVWIDGQGFPSVSAAARAHGAKPEIIHRLIQTHAISPGMALRQAGVR